MSYIVPRLIQLRLPSLDFFGASVLPMFMSVLFGNWGGRLSAMSHSCMQAAHILTVSGCERRCVSTVRTSYGSQLLSPYLLILGFKIPEFPKIHTKKEQSRGGPVTWSVSHIIRRTATDPPSAVHCQNVRSHIEANWPKGT